MKIKTQSGFGILPVMIVVLILAIAGIGYTVYRHQANIEQDSLGQGQDNKAAELDASVSLADVQQATASSLDAIISDRAFKSERIDSDMVFKDKQTQLFVQLKAKDLATRFTLSAVPTESAAAAAVKSFHEHLTAAGFVYYSGNSATDVTDPLLAGNTAYQRDSNEYCYISSLTSSYFDLGCVTAAADEIHKLAVELNPYHEAHLGEIQKLYPTENFIYQEFIALNEETRQTVLDKYEVVNGSVGGVGDIDGFYETQGGGRVQFYREIGGEWMEGAGSGNGLSACKNYDTEAEQLIYAENGCGTDDEGATITVKEYWQ